VQLTTGLAVCDQRLTSVHPCKTTHKTAEFCVDVRRVAVTLPEALAWTSSGVILVVNFSETSMLKARQVQRPGKRSFALAGLRNPADREKQLRKSVTDRSTCCRYAGRTGSNLRRRSRRQRAPSRRSRRLPSRNTSRGTCNARPHSLSHRTRCERIRRTSPPPPLAAPLKQYNTDANWTMVKYFNEKPRCRFVTVRGGEWFPRLSGSLTSIFNTNMANQERGAIPTQWRNARGILTSTLTAFLFSSQKRKRDLEAHINYYASAYNRGRQLSNCKKTKSNTTKTSKHP